MYKSVNKLDYIEYRENLTGKYTLSMDGELVEKLLILINRGMTEWWINCRFLELEYIDSDIEALIHKQYRTTSLDGNYYSYINDLKPKQL